MKLLNFTIIKLTACLVFGILIGNFASFSIKLITISSCFLLVILFLAYRVSNREIAKTIWFGLVSYMIMLIIGIMSVNFHNPKNFKNHYSKYLNKSDSATIITFQIKEVLKPNIYQEKYIAKIIALNNNPVIGKLLINVEKDSTNKTPLKVDDTYIINTDFMEILNPVNPYQFNYKDYLEKQYVYNQVFINQNSLLKIENNNQTVFGYASNLRETINKKLQQFNFKKNELAIINALFLGQRQNIDKGVYNNYINAGAVHILAVSGLHVGIVLLLLNFLLKPIEYLKHGKLLKTVLILLLLWSFAIIAGLSASVTRAVTMFSIVAIALNWKRPTNIYNTLAISMFFLLLFKPLLLFDVGFQLSYIAVFSIVWIQPLLYNLWKPKWKIVNLFWNIFTVTTAAQIGVIPISLYYFHQFPGLFFISNLVIIPFLGFILGFGFFIIILALSNSLPEFLANIFGSIIHYLNTFIGWIANQEQFLIQDISFNLLLLFPIYLLIISTISFIKNMKYNRLLFMLLSIVILQSVLIYKKQYSFSKQLIVFNKSRYTQIGLQNKKQLIVYHNLDSLAKTKDNTIKNYLVGSFTSLVKEESILDFYKHKNKTLLVIDSLGIYNLTKLKPEYILLRNSPKINLKRLIDSLKPKLIIADGSNYKSYVKRWKETCKKEKLPFHSTYEKGAYIFK